MVSGFTEDLSLVGISCRKYGMEDVVFVNDNSELISQLCNEEDEIENMGASSAHFQAN